MTNREGLGAMLEALDAKMPALLEESPDIAHFWPKFAGEAGAIVDAGARTDEEWITDRVHIILSTHGIDPSGGMLS